ncbi:S8 family peptidase [Amycolatopsis marina]|uniref:S8 family peptidase n=1 Tax=Amycolatopsis marina TaxID=490629 RepID=UPI000B82401C|nr:S8 family peptidase [Amycolatopsis marina]
MGLRGARAVLATTAVVLVTSGMGLVVPSAAAAPVEAAVTEPGEQAEPPSWGLDRIDQREGFDQLYRYPTRAEQVTVYVIDTGVDGTNPEFEGRVWPGKDFVDDDDHATDGNGHGTHLAGVIGAEHHGIAKDVRIMPVRVLDDNGAGSLLDILAGIEWVRVNATQPAVAVFGIGGPPEEALDEAVRELAAVMPVAVPAGSSGASAGDFSPGRVAEALTVAAADRTDAAVSRSNSGSAVDLFAPGAEIPAPSTGGAVSVQSGTSIAAAHVAGAAALYRAQHPEATPAEVGEALLAAATEDALSAVPDGTANRLLFTGSAER